MQHHYLSPLFSSRHLITCPFLQTIVKRDCKKGSSQRLSQVSNLLSMGAEYSYISSSLKVVLFVLKSVFVCIITVPLTGQNTYLNMLLPFSRVLMSGPYLNQSRQEGTARRPPCPSAQSRNLLAASTTRNPTRRCCCRPPPFCPA